MTRNVLVIEDQQDIAKLIKLHLEDLSCNVDVVYDGSIGLAEAQATDYDIIILDLMLPGMDGLEICRRLRSKENYTPIMMLTAKSSEIERVVGLELGADDYLTKPFSVMELMARVKAIFRRVDALAANATSDVPKNIKSGALLIDESKREVTLHDKKIELTSKEFDLLLHFAQNPGRVYTRTQLLDTVWGYENAGYEHTVNSHINRLRAKIESDHAKPNYILTVWGVGYKFTDQETKTKE